MTTPSALLLLVILVVFFVLHTLLLIGATSAIMFLQLSVLLIVLRHPKALNPYTLTPQHLNTLNPNIPNPERTGQVPVSSVTTTTTVGSTTTTPEASVHGCFLRARVFEVFFWGGVWGVGSPSRV